VDLDLLFRDAFHGSGTGLAVAAVPSGLLLAANDAFCALVGRTEAQLRVTAASELIHAEDRAARTAAVDDVTAGRRRTVRLEHRYLQRGRQRRLVCARTSRASRTSPDACCTCSATWRTSRSGRRAAADAAHQKEMLRMAQRVAERRTLRGTRHR
jgi:PAS domain S-box-containing protein